MIKSELPFKTLELASIHRKSNESLMLSTPPNPAAWVWGYQLAVRLSKVTADAFGQLRTTVLVLPRKHSGQQGRLLSRLAPIRRGGPALRAWGLDIYLSVFHRPKGEQRIAQAFRPGKAYGTKIALKGRPTFGRYSKKVTFVKSDPSAFQKLTNLFWYKNLQAQLGVKETGH